MSNDPRVRLISGRRDDEEFGLLTAHEGGYGAFGVYVLCVNGAELRRQQGKARRVEGSDALVFDDSLAHTLTVCGVTPKALGRALTILGEVAARAGTEPWMTVDASGRLVIRSFFVRSGANSWGGARTGAGRPPKTASLDSSNQVEILNSIAPGNSSIQVNLNSTPPMDSSNQVEILNYSPSTNSRIQVDLNSPHRNAPASGASAGAELNSIPPPPLKREFSPLSQGGGGIRAREGGDSFETATPVEAPAPPPPVNTPEEVEDAVRFVDTLYDGLNGVPQAARVQCLTFKAGWVKDAAENMHASGKADTRYLGKILARYRAQGASDRERDAAAPVVTLPAARVNGRPTQTRGERQADKLREIVAARDAERRAAAPTTDGTE